MFTELCRIRLRESRAESGSASEGGVAQNMEKDRGDVVDSFGFKELYVYNFVSSDIVKKLCRFASALKSYLNRVSLKNLDNANSILFIKLLRIPTPLKKLSINSLC